jgi:AraC family transcriptional regulator of arabinose operon
MHFSIDEDTNYFQKLQLPFCTPIQLEDHSIINNMMLELLTEIFSPGGRKAATIDAMTNAMFHKFSELYLAQKNNTDSTNHYRQMLAGLRKQLLSFSSVSVSTEQIAQDMHISRSYLEHMYKRFFGVTMQQDMITGRISYAGQLLRTTNYTISRVATVCGYDNLEHFSRQFKKVMKCSPRQYRQQAYK